jgi:hypothetical protein
MSFRSRILTSFRSRLGIAAGVALLAPAIVLPASASQASAQSCYIYGNPGFTTCVYVSGGGLYVNYVKGWTHNNTRSTWHNLHIEIEGPPGLLKNCSPFTLGPNATSPNCTWTRNGTVTAGRYCSTLWWWNGSGYLNFGTPCVNVHS